MQKIRLAAIVSGLCLSSLNVLAVDSSDKFFAAYQVALSSNLPQALKKQANSQKAIDDVAFAIIQKTNNSGLVQRYKDDSGFKQKIQNSVRQYLLTSDANNFFEDTATRVFNQLYSLEELKAQYQFNNSANGKLFLSSQLNLQQESQKRMDQLASFEFRPNYEPELEAKTKEILQKLSIDSNPSVSMESPPLEAVTIQVSPRDNSESVHQSSTQVIVKETTENQDEVILPPPNVTENLVTATETLKESTAVIAPEHVAIESIDKQVEPAQAALIPPVSVEQPSKVESSTAEQLPVNTISTDRTTSENVPAIREDVQAVAVVENTSTQNSVIPDASQPPNIETPSPEVIINPVLDEAKPDVQAVPVVEIKQEANLPELISEQVANTVLAASEGLDTTVADAVLDGNNQAQVGLALQVVSRDVAEQQLKPSTNESLSVGNETVIVVAEQDQSKEEVKEEVKEGPVAPIPQIADQEEPLKDAVEVAE